MCNTLKIRHLFDENLAKNRPVYIVKCICQQTLTIALLTSVDGSGILETSKGNKTKGKEKQIMLKIKVNFTESSNQGSFAINAIAEALGGDWSEKSSTDSSGIVTNVGSENREFAESMLNNDENVESYTISEE